MNSLNDFCLWGIGESERIEVAWCLQEGHGTLPAGSITGAHWVETPNFIQVTGIGNFVALNGGELDPHGADGNGNPVGGIVMANGVAIKEWTSFISSNQFCFRFCPDGHDAAAWCQHIYDLEGCEWNEPGSYEVGFDACDGESGQMPGIYVENGVTSTYYQGTDENNPTPAPAAHPAGATSNCQYVSNLGVAVSPLAGADVGCNIGSIERHQLEPNLEFGVLDLQRSTILLLLLFFLFVPHNFDQGTQLHLGR
ncbi:hypothetical protein RQP46_001317 [Phenoliferia psychrophenolica]